MLVLLFPLFSLSFFLSHVVACAAASEFAINYT